MVTECAWAMLFVLLGILGVVFLLREKVMDYRGIAALVIACALGGTLVLGVGGVVIWGRPLSEAGSEALIAIGGALAGALAAYLSMRSGGT